MSDLPGQEIHQFRKQILSLSGEDVSKCIQCGKCTAGCPISPEMDLQPNQVIRFVQINDPKTVLSCQAIWLCASCQTCSVRCPEEIEIAEIMDSLRKLSLEEKVPLGEERIVKFDKIFLGTVRKRGRVHEMELIMRYNLAVRQPFKDAHLGSRMFMKGKLHFLGKKVKELNQIREIFAKSKRFFKPQE